MSHQRELRRVGVGFIFAAPWLVGFAAFTLYSAVASLYYSFTQCNTMQPPQWVGLDNYTTLFTADPTFWTAVGNTLYMVAVGLNRALFRQAGITRPQSTLEELDRDAATLTVIKNGRIVRMGFIPASAVGRR